MIYVILTSAYPQGNVTSERAHMICKGMVDSGGVVKILIAHATEQINSQRNFDFLGIFENVNFQYPRKKITRFRNKILQKILDLYDHLVVLAYLFKNLKAEDKLLLIGWKLDFRAVVPLIGKIHHTKTYIEINEHPLTGNRSSAGKIARLVSNWWAHNMIQGAIVISRPLEVYLSESIRVSTLIIPILGITKFSEFDLNSNKNESYIVHMGAISDDKDGFLQVLNVVEQLNLVYEKSISLIITGQRSSIEKKNMYKLLDDQNIKKTIIQFAGYLDRGQLDKLLHESLFALIVKPDSFQNQYCFPTKLISYIHNDVPLVLSGVGDHLSYFSDKKNSIVVGECNIETLVESIIKLLADKKLMQNIATNAKKLIENDFNYKLHGERILRLLGE